MRRKNFERTEYLLVAAFSIISLIDVVLILLKLETLHQVFESFMVTTLLGLSTIMLVRWYRHHDELLECLKLSPELLRQKEIIDWLNEIAIDCFEIRQNRWPKIAARYMDQRFEHLRTEIHKLKAEITELKGGRMKTDLHLGRLYSPEFFRHTRGPSFVTHFRDWGYWNTPEGEKQLAANSKAIKKRFGTITRIFIIPLVSEPRTKYPSDATIQQQVDAHVIVMAIAETSAEKKYCRDVGVFFAKGGKVVEFMSEWDYTGQGFATITFKGESLAVGKEMHDYLTSNARVIKNLDDWKDFKQVTDKQESEIATRAHTPV